MSAKILIVLTSHSRLGETGNKTGFWLEELATPYYQFIEAGYEVVLASPTGGQPPLDPKSDLPEFQTAATRRFLEDKLANQLLQNTVKLTDIEEADFDAIFYPGGHGPLWDLVDNRTSIRLLEAFWDHEKPVAAVCHGPIVLAHAIDRAGVPIVRGRRVTAFTNDEEAAIGLTDIVPVSVQNILIEKGGLYSAGENFGSFIQQDGWLITGQNPASSAATANAVIKTLSRTANKATSDNTQVNSADSFQSVSVEQQAVISQKETSKCSV